MGGMERASSNLANQFAIDGLEVVFISIFKRNHFFTLDNRINLIEPKNFNFSKLNFIKTILFIRKSIKKNRVNNILVFGKIYSAMTSIAMIGLNKKIVISERSSPYYIWPFTINIISRIAFSLNTPFAVVSQTKLAESIQRNYYSKKSTITVIPNAVRDIQLYPDIKRENIIISVGRIGEYIKGFDLLIKAFIIANPSNWILKIVGNIEGAENLTDIVKQEKFSEKIIFVEPQNNLDLLFAKSSVFVIPSRSEGFPNALIEAMASGLACVSYDFDAGPRDIIINNLNGIIVEKENIQELAFTILKVVNDAELRSNLSSEALKIRETLNLRLISKKYLRIFE
jgi:glycosyltransferase involved in cell wall biosynthesis